MKWLLPFLFLLPHAGFATITATNRGTGTNNSSSTTTVITLPTMTSGNTGILAISMDNANASGSNLGGTGLSSGYFDDSVGNRWYVRSNSSQAATAGNNLEVWILTSNLTASISSSNSLTVTFANASTAEAWSFIEASTDVSGGAVIYGTSAIATTSTAGTAATITANLEPSPGNLIVGVCGAEQGSADTMTGDSDTLNGSWTSIQSLGIGTTTTGMFIGTQTKVVNLYGAQSYDITVGSSTDLRPGWAILVETDPKARTIGGNNTSSTTITVPVNLPIVAGSLAVLCVSADNSGTGSVNFPSTPTDAGSNTWTKRQGAVFNPAGLNSGVEFGIYTGAITTGLAVGSNITIATAATTIPAKTWVLWEFAPTGAGTVTYVTGTAGGGANTATPTLTNGATAAGNYVIYMGGAEGFNTWVGDADTVNGPWKTMGSAGKGTSAGASMSITSQWKQVTASGNQTYSPTLTIADTILGGIELNDSSTVGPTAAQKAAFFMLFP